MAAAIRGVSEQKIQDFFQPSLKRLGPDYLTVISSRIPLFLLLMLNCTYLYLEIYSSSRQYHA